MLLLIVESTGGKSSKCRVDFFAALISLWSAQFDVISYFTTLDFLSPAAIMMQLRNNRQKKMKRVEFFGVALDVLFFSK